MELAGKMDLSPHFERNCEDRIEKPWTPKSPRAINALKNSRSMPPRGLPKVSSLTRSPTSFLNGDLDFGLLDMSVDDGTNGDLDDTVRSLRFSTAASTIDALFSCPSPTEAVSIEEEDTENPPQPFDAKQNVPEDYVSGEPIVPLDEAVVTATTLKSHTDSFSTEVEDTENSPQSTVGKQSVSEKSAFEEPLIPLEEAIAPVSSDELEAERPDTVNKIKQHLEFFDTEPVTPPRSEPKHNVRSSKKSVQTVTAFDTSHGDGPHECVESHSPGQQDTGTGGEVVPSPKNTPRKVLQSTMQAGRKLSSLLSKKEEPLENHMTTNSPEKHEDPQTAPRDERLSLLHIFKRRSMKSGGNESPKNEDNPMEPGDNPERANEKEKPKLFQVFRRKSTNSADTCSSGQQNGEACEESDPPAKKELPQFLQFFKKMSSVSRDRTSEDHQQEETGAEEPRPTRPKFAKIFKRKSTNPENKTNGPMQAPVEENSDGGHDHAWSSSRRNENRPGLQNFAKKIGSFLAMLVH